MIQFPGTVLEINTVLTWSENTHRLELITLAD